MKLSVVHATKVDVLDSDITQSFTDVYAELRVTYAEILMALGIPVTAHCHYTLDTNNEEGSPVRTFVIPTIIKEE